MSGITYYSAIYNILPSKNIASRICFPEYECDLLPREIGLRELADLVANMQKICFKDKNKDNHGSMKYVGQSVWKVIKVLFPLLWT